MSDLYRAEIISNQSVQEDIVERLEKELPSIQYTVIPEIHGRGTHTKKLGDTIWPEMNFVLFAYQQWLHRGKSAVSGHLYIILY